MQDTLLLNTTGSPVSRLPLSAISWREAIRYMVLDKVNVLEWHEDWIVHSANWQTRVPSVIMLKEYINKKASVRFSKDNIYLRDEYKCQYCYTDVFRSNPTLDHVLPLSHGGKTNWENCVCSCGPCNSRKGNNKSIVPVRAPYKPSYYELLEKQRKIPQKIKYETWRFYLQEE